MKYGAYSFYLLVFILFSISGCGGYHSKMYTGPDLEKSEISTITTDNQYVTIGGFDRKSTTDKSNPKDFANGLIWGARFPRTITTKPGTHQILPCFQFPYQQSGCGENWIELETEPGESYIVKHEFNREISTYRAWIEKQSGSERTVHQKLLNK